MFDPESLLERLVSAGVEFIIIGGVAVGFHGVIRGTKDLDICPSPEPGNLERLAALLGELGATQAEVGDLEARELPHDPTNPADLAEGGNVRLTTALGSLDVMQWIPGVPSDQAFPFLAPEAVQIDWRGLQLRVCSLAHLQLMKRTAGRPQDLQDLRDLDVARGGEPDR